MFRLHSSCNTSMFNAIHIDSPCSQQCETAVLHMEDIWHWTKQTFNNIPKGESNTQTYVSSRNSAIHNAYCIVLHSSSCTELKHSLQNIIIVHKHITLSLPNLFMQCITNVCKTSHTAQGTCNIIVMQAYTAHNIISRLVYTRVHMILQQVHLQKPCYDFSFL